MGIRICHIGITSNHWNPSIWKPVWPRKFLLVCPDHRHSSRLSDYGGCFWIVAHCSQNRSEVLRCHAIYIPCHQWCETSDLGYWPFVGECSEWESVVGGVGLECELVVIVGVE